jgi:hypothetical protein
MNSTKQCIGRVFFKWKNKEEEVVKKLLGIKKEISLESVELTSNIFNLIE